MTERGSSSIEPGAAALAWEDVLAFALKEDEPDDRCFAVRWQVQDDAPDPARLLPLRRAAGGLLRSAVRLAATDLVPSAEYDGFMRVAGEGLRDTGDDPGIARFALVDLAVQALPETRDPERMTRLVRILVGLTAGSSPGHRFNLLLRTAVVLPVLERVAPELARVVRAVPAVPPRASVEERVAELEALRNELLTLCPPVAPQVAPVAPVESGEPAPPSAPDEASTGDTQVTGGDGVDAAPLRDVDRDEAPRRVSAPRFVMTRAVTGSRILVNGEELPMGRFGHLTAGATWRTCMALALVIQTHHPAGLAALEPERWNFTRRSGSESQGRPADRTELKTALERIDPLLTIADAGDRLTLPVYVDASLIALARKLFPDLAEEDLTVVAAPTDAPPHAGA